MIYKHSCFVLIFSSIVSCKSNVSSSLTESKATSDEEPRYYDKNSENVPMDPIVPRIGAEGVNKRIPHVEEKFGYNHWVKLRIAFQCGFEGTIEERISDCETRKTPSAVVVTFEDTTVNDLELKEYSWSLVTSISSGPNEYFQVWRDNKTKLLWGDKYGGSRAFTTNWCKASGSNSKEGSPLGEADVDKICSDNQFQDQKDPLSYCAEDLEHLSGKLKLTGSDGKSIGKNLAKGNLSKSEKQGKVTWWLPTADQFREAQLHGANLLLPNFQFEKNSWFWTSSIDAFKTSSSERKALVFKGESGGVIGKSRKEQYSVRCVGKAEK